MLTALISRASVHPADLTIMLLEKNQPLIAVSARIRQPKKGHFQFPAVDRSLLSAPSSFRRRLRWSGLPIALPVTRSIQGVAVGTVYDSLEICFEHLVG